MNTILIRLWGSVMSMLTVRVLGPLQVAVGDKPVPLTASRLRTLLAGLAMSADRTVSMEQLTEIVWGDEPPADPRRSLQTYAARLRAALGARFVETQPTGLRLRTDPNSVDALRFVRLLENNTANRLAEALSLWQGTPFDGVASEHLKRTEQPRLVEWYLTALERHIDINLRDGAHESLTAELENLTARYPWRESLWVRLLVVLDCRGRPAEAVRRYESVRRRISEELGTDPSPELQRLHAELLTRSHTTRNVSVSRQMA